MVGGALDVTDRHDSPLSRRRGRLLQAVLDNRSFGVVVCDHADEIIQANSVFAESPATRLPPWSAWLSPRVRGHRRRRHRWPDGRPMAR